MSWKSKRPRVLDFSRMLDFISFTLVLNYYVTAFFEERKIKVKRNYQHFRQAQKDETHTSQDLGVIMENSTSKILYYH